MNFIQQLSPSNLPASVTDKNSIQALRERILQTVLLIILGFGIPVSIIASIRGINDGEGYLVFVYIPVMMVVGALAYFRNLPYTLRGLVITYLVYILAVSELFESGQIGEARMFLIAFVAMTATFFPFQQILISVLLSLALIIGSGLYASLVPNPIISVLSHILEGTPWPIGSIVFTMLASMVATAISLFIQGMDVNLQKQAALTVALERERESLEKRVSDRTQGLQHRIIQLRTVAEICRSTSGVNVTKTLLDTVANLVKDRFDLYYVGIFLVDRSHQYAVLKAATGNAGKRMLAAGHQLAINGNSMIGWSIANRKPRIALDAGLDAVRFNNPNLPLTRSELALPIIAYDHVLGSVSVQSFTPNAFDEDDIVLLESVADILAIALENERLYLETLTDLDEIRTLNHEYLQQAWAETIATYGTLEYEYVNPNLTEAVGSSQTVQVPLVLRDTVIGQIDLEIDQPDLSEEERAMLDNMSAQTALALESARLLYDTERWTQQEQQLNQLTNRFSRAMSIDGILRAAAQDFGQLPTVVDVTVQLNSPEPSGASAVQIHHNGSNGKERA